jgi:O-antigen/teichoic acid export membrane protein
MSVWSAFSERLFRDRTLQQRAFAGGAAFDADSNHKRLLSLNSSAPESLEFRAKVYSGVVWSLVHTWGAQAVNLLVIIVLARLLTPEMFGLVALASVFVSLVKSYVDQGLSTALVQRKELEPEHFDVVFWASIVVGLSCTIATALAAPLIAAAFKNQELEQVVRGLSIVFLLDGLSVVQQAVLRRNLAFRMIAVRSLAAVGAGGIVGVTSALAGFEVMSLVLQQITVAFVGAVVLWFSVAWRPRFSFSIKHARDLVAFGYNILGIRLLTFATRRSDDLLIGYFLGAVLLGYYVVAYKLYKVMLDVLAAVVSRVALPALSHLQADVKAFRSGVLQATRLVATVAFPFFLGVAVLANAVVPVMFGSQWTPAVPVVQILSIGGIAQCISLIFQQALIAFGRPGTALRVLLASSTAMLIGFAITVNSGIVAVATAFTIVSILTVPLQHLVLSRTIGFAVKDLVSALSPSLIGGLAMVPILLVWKAWSPNMSDLVFLSTAVLIAGVAYTGAVGLFFPGIIQSVVDPIRMKLGRPA